VHKGRLSSESELTVVDPYLSPEACRAKALDCLTKADALDDPREKGEATPAWSLCHRPQIRHRVPSLSSTIAALH
jgi:hypothetical protein